jgi:hypothetical protein
MPAHGVHAKNPDTERAMPNSGLHGFIIDCQTDDIDGAAKFRSEALRLPLNPDAYPAEADDRYLAAGPVRAGMWRRRSRDCRDLAPQSSRK